MDDANGGLLLSFYGDDLTGSTDALEALSLNGVETVLFVRPPSAPERAHFRHAGAVGLAGTSRSETPAWMAEHLPPALRWLKGENAPICHYKVCSTFDSAPGIGSIGRAIEIGASVFASPVVPLVVGVPQLRRYTFFGQLFAAYAGEVHRLDRHPVMSRHPVTPMREADLRRHLATQTDLSVGLVDLPTLGQPDIDGTVDAMVDAHDILLIDVADEQSQLAAGWQLERLQKAGARFVVGSSGVEYALIAAWRRDGRIAEPPGFASPGKVGHIAVLSGSVSPTTERQIHCACTQGFALLPIDPEQLLGEGATDRAIEQALAILEQGQSAILATALGPASAKPIAPQLRHEVGRRLGFVLNALVARTGLRRAVVAGGDTSSHALRELGILALSLRLPLPRTPGSPLCRTFRADGSEGPDLAFKGGQIGSDDYFVQIRDGVG